MMNAITLTKILAKILKFSYVIIITAHPDVQRIAKVHIFGKDKI